MSARDRPLVSVITPCYNGETYLDRYFASILSQTYLRLELIFIDDGSEDRTLAVAQDYRAALEGRGIRYTVLSQENAGQAAALNRGLKLFAGEYLTWPDADDVMTPDCIEKKVAYLQAHPALEMCVCRVAKVMENDPQTVIGFYALTQAQREGSLFEDLLLTRGVYCTPGAYMVRADAVDRRIASREIYPGRGGQNLQMLLPLAFGGRYGYIDEALYTYYLREDSHSHGIDSPEKVMIQWENVERIVLETLRRMPEGVLEAHDRQVRAHYARWRFGNALDTRNPKLVHKVLGELSSQGMATLSDFMHYAKCAALHKL